MKKFTIVALIIFLIDLVTKQYVRSQDIQTQGHFVDVTYVTNTGSLFSLFESVRAVNYIFILLSLVALFFIIRYVVLHAQSNERLPLALLTAGILGNLFDRITVGAVIDWINFHWWPIFNVADTAIVVGVAWTILLIVLDYAHKPIKN